MRARWEDRRMFSVRKCFVRPNRPRCESFPSVGPHGLKHRSSYKARASLSHCQEKRAWARRARKQSHDFAITLWSMLYKQHLNLWCHHTRISRIFNSKNCVGCHQLSQIILLWPSRRRNILSTIIVSVPHWYHWYFLSNQEIKQILSVKLSCLAGFNLFSHLKLPLFGGRSPPRLGPVWQTKRPRKGTTKDKKTIAASSVSLGIRGTIYDLSELYDWFSFWMI